MIFNNKETDDKMVSFSFPFVALKDVELEQPVFGAKYIKGKVRSTKMSAHEKRGLELS